VSRYLRRTSPSDQARRLWAIFLRNHREVIAAMDFLTVPTLTYPFIATSSSSMDGAKSFISMSQSIQAQPGLCSN
jgi:hypothetical protein